jgi:hypothetical protein
MGRRIVIRPGQISGARDHLAIADDHSAVGKIAVPRLIEGHPHEFLVLGGRRPVVSARAGAAAGSTAAHAAAVMTKRRLARVVPSGDMHSLCRFILQSP